MKQSEALAEARNRYGALSFVKLGTYGPTMKPDGSIRHCAFHEVFKGDEMRMERWGIGESWDEALADCERRGVLS